MDLHIRTEHPEDAAAVDDILVKAFGRTYEADLVIRLREARRVALSLTAEAGGQVAGHILFSPLALDGYAPPHAPEDIPPPAFDKSPRALARLRARLLMPAGPGSGSRIARLPASRHRRGAHQTGHSYGRTADLGGRHRGGGTR